MSTFEIFLSKNDLEHIANGYDLKIEIGDKRFLKADEIVLRPALRNDVMNPMPDIINKPSHYQGEFGLKAIDVVRNFAGDLTAVQGFYWGNAMKYLLRFQKKNGLEDLKKARKNLDWLIDEMEGKSK